jgi:hypothetical protein
MIYLEKALGPFAATCIAGRLACTQFSFDRLSSIRRVRLSPMREAKLPALGAFAKVSEI